MTLLYKMHCNAVKCRLARVSRSRWLFGDCDHIGGFIVSSYLCYSYFWSVHAEQHQCGLRRGQNRLCHALQPTGDSGWNYYSLQKRIWVLQVSMKNKTWYPMQIINYIGHWNSDTFFRNSDVSKSLNYNYNEFHQFQNNESKLRTKFEFEYF